ncbi:MAG: hypothetical protein HXY38_14425 [Chloroflexi bacterium]|nr:hypothetical protein [Chloroflexota bacterium]
MSASLGLYRLQQVDRQIDRTRSRLDAIHKTLENDAELKNAKIRHAQANQENIQAGRSLKQIENEAGSLIIKIEQTESSLYSGNVKNPKELQDLQKELVSLKKHLGILEERELEAMLLTENTATALNQSQIDLEVVQSRLGSEHKKLLEEQNELIKQLERLGQEREAAAAPIETALLAAYEDLRKQKRGLAVAEVEEDACAACGTTLNAALQQNARSQKRLVHCPSCGRILFAN